MTEIQLKGRKTLTHPSFSHLSVHVVNRILRETQKSIPKFFNGKNTFKKCNPPGFTVYPSRLNNKDFPIWCNVDFVSLQYKKAKIINMSRDMTKQTKRLCGQ